MKEKQNYNNYELETSDDSNDSQNIQQIDGLYSWLRVIAGFMVYFSLFGTSGSFGIYLANYLKTDFKNQSSSQLAFIGSLGAGLSALTSIPSGMLITKIGYRPTILLGSIFIGFGLILASFANQFWILILGHAILFGIGKGLCFIPVISIIPQWFNKYIGLAVGICSAGSGIGGLVLSPIIQVIIDRLGWRWALRINGIFSTLILATCSIILKPRFNYKSPKLFDSKIVLNPKFLALWLQGAISCFAFYVPFFIIPLYCRYYQILPTSASLMVGLMNGSSALGKIAAGLIAQRIGNINTLFFNNLICSLTFVLIWYFSTNTWSLILFSLIFGFLSSAMFTNSALLTPELFGYEKLAQVNGLFYTCLTPGFLVGTVIATSIIDASTVDSYTNYLPCMLYLFGCYFSSCLFLIWLRVQVTRSLIAKA